MNETINFSLLGRFACDDSNSTLKLELLQWEHLELYQGNFSVTIFERRVTMLDKQPNTAELTALIGPSLYEVWKKLSTLIDETYDMECLWNKGGKAWDYEYKYRRGGKTLCAFYARENCVGVLIIFGKEERAKFEAERKNYSEPVQMIYEEAKTYHDGKWVMFHPVDTSMFDDFMQLLRIKRKPNRK